MRELELFSLRNPVYSIEGFDYFENFKYEETIGFYFKNYQNDFLGARLKLKNVIINMSKSKSIMEENLGFQGLVFKDALYDVIKTANTLESVFVKSNLVTKVKKNDACFLFLYKGVPERCINNRENKFEVIDIKNHNTIDEITIGSFNQYFNLGKELGKEGKYLKLNSIEINDDVDKITKLDILKFKIGGRHLFSKKIVEKIKEKVSDVKFERTRVKYFY